MIGTTEYVVKNVISDLKDKEVSFEAGERDDYLGELTVDVLLKRDTSGIAERIEVDLSGMDSLKIAEMIEARNRNNHIYEVKSCPPSGASGSFLGKVKNKIKLLIYKMVAPMLDEVILEQNKFNASVTGSINLIADNLATVAEFSRRQYEVMNREVELLRSEVDRLRKETVAERLEVVKAEKHHHWEVDQLKEQIEELQKQLSGR
ncbi:MAG: hypothetical protein IJZ85_06870 [Lachnospiraceae bacterium]|nr:hypothetical protein [Lachnospiraceae bacterium]